MALKSYIMTTDFKSPYVTATGLPHNPQAIRFRQFKRGEIINGEMKHANNKPAFVLVQGVLVIPLQVIKELVTKAVVSHTDGEGKAPKKDIKSVIQKAVTSSKKNTNPKVRYGDALLIGAVIGFAGIIIAEKQGWISEPDNRYRLYGAIGVGLVGMYLVYRQSTQNKSKGNAKFRKE